MRAASASTLRQVPLPTCMWQGGQGAGRDKVVKVVWLVPLRARPGQPEQGHHPAGYHRQAPLMAKVRVEVDWKLKTFAEPAMSGPSRDFDAPAPDPAWPGTSRCRRSHAGGLTASFGGGSRTWLSSKQPQRQHLRRRVSSASSAGDGPRRPVTPEDVEVGVAPGAFARQDAQRAHAGIAGKG